MSLIRNEHIVWLQIPENMNIAEVSKKNTEQHEEVNWPETFNTKHWLEVFNSNTSQPAADSTLKNPPKELNYLALNKAQTSQAL